MAAWLYTHCFHTPLFLLKLFFTKSMPLAGQKKTSQKGGSFEMIMDL
jgi:hypothetical protein